VEVVASLSQGRTAAVQCSLFKYKSVPVIFEPPCIYILDARRGKQIVAISLLCLSFPIHTFICLFVHTKEVFLP